MGELQVLLTGDNTALKKSFSEVDAGAKQTESGVTGAFKNISVAAAAAGAAVVAGLGVALNEALNIEVGAARLTAQLGLTASESERIGGVAGELYAGAYGESMGAVNDAIRFVIRDVEGMGTASSAVLDDFTGKTISVADAMEQDLGGVTRAVGQLMRTGLAPDADYALDLITAGFQTGADSGGDFLDTINEYSTQFRKLGLDGDTALGLISQGMQAGARDADIVADAIKEFSIRAVDGSELTAAGFEAIGLSAEDMTAAIAAGGPAAEEALGLTLDRLRGIEDPALRAQAAVALFGTQAEDLGSALYALDLDTAASGLGDVAGAAEAVDEALGNTASATLTAFWRSLQQNVVTALGDYAIPAIQGAGDALGQLGEAFGAVGGFIEDNERLITALAIAVGVKLVGSFVLAQARAVSLALTVAALNGSSLAGVLTGTLSLSAGLAAAQAAALRLVAALAPLAVLTGIGFAVMEIISLANEAGNAEDAVKAMLAPFEDAEPGQELNGLVTALRDVQAAADAAQANIIELSNQEGFSFGSGDDLIENIRLYQEAAAAMADLEFEAQKSKNIVGQLGETYGLSASEVKALAEANGIDLTDSLSAADKQLQKVLRSSQGTTSAQDEAAAAADRLAGGFGDAAENAEDLLTVLDDLTGRFVTTAEATSNYEAAVDDVTQAILDQAEASLGPMQDALNANATGFDLNTAAGRDLQSSFFDLRDSGNDLIQKLIEAGDVSGALAADKRLREQFIASANDAGIFGQAAENLANDVLGIPNQRHTDITEAGSATVAAAADKVTSKLNAIPPRTSSTIDVYGAESAADAAGKVADEINRIPTSKTSTVIYETVYKTSGSIGGLAAGGIVETFAAGGVAMAPGGRLTPMSAGLAQIVGPNTFRVIGDRAQDDEAFIPINHAGRSMAILEETARRMGRNLIPAGLADQAFDRLGRVSGRRYAPFATGGIADSGLYVDSQVHDRGAGQGGQPTGPTYNVTLHATPTVPTVRQMKDALRDIEYLHGR